MDSRQPGPEEALALRYHGGNINAARRLFPEAPEPWIDLSTGINAVPYPVDGIAPEAWTRLPDAASLDTLESVARAAYGASPSVGVVAAAGAQALIQWLPRIFPARRVGVLGLTYREHETSWRASGAEVVTVRSLPDLAAFDVGLVVNPNNPDGRRFGPEDMAEIAGALARHGGRLIIDEAFMDLLGRQESLIPHLPGPGAIVLRSFGKAYGLAGVRLGFAVASMDDCARVRAALGPWPVSGPAIEIGRRALADELVARCDCATIARGGKPTGWVVAIRGFRDRRGNAFVPAGSGKPSTGIVQAALPGRHSDTALPGQARLAPIWDPSCAGGMDAIGSGAAFFPRRNWQTMIIALGGQGGGTPNARTESCDRCGLP